MTIGRKLGLWSVAFACVSPITSYAWPAMTVAAIVLGILAATRDSKWWLAVPFFTTGWVALLLYVYSHSD